MTRPECQHLARGDGGTWCGDPDAEFGGIGLALRPRVPVCAVCHMKAMHYRADREAAAESALAHMREARDAARAEVERLTGQIEAAKRIGLGHLGRPWASVLNDVLRALDGTES